MYLRISLKIEPMVSSGVWRPAFLSCMMLGKIIIILICNSRMRLVGLIGFDVWRLVGLANLSDPDASGLYFLTDP
jgi:hypothetical protein